MMGQEEPVEQSSITSTFLSLVCRFMMNIISHMFKFLRKGDTNCLLLESACMRGRAVQQARRATSGVELRHKENAVLSAVWKGKSRRPVTKYIPFPAGTGWLFQLHCNLGPCSFSPAVLEGYSPKASEGFRSRGELCLPLCSANPLITRLT